MIIMKNIIGVIRDDMNGLVHRLNFHQEGYIKVFSNERTRQHFEEIFYSRYKTVSGSDLSTLDPNTLEVISRFYKEVTDLYLYFRMTEDMPSAVANKLSTSLKLINDLHSKFIDLGIAGHDLGSAEESGSRSVQTEVDLVKVEEPIDGVVGESADDVVDVLEENIDETDTDSEIEELSFEELNEEPQGDEQVFSLDQLEEDDSDGAPPPFTK